MRGKEPPSGRAAPKLRIKSTQSFSPVLTVKDGVIVTKSGDFAKLMEVSPVNFELRSPPEQEEIITLFSSALRTMPDSMHLKIISTKSDISPFIDGLISAMYSESSPGCRELQYDQMQLIHSIGRSQSVSRRFFLSFMYGRSSVPGKRPSFEDIRLSLDAQARSIAASLESCGNAVISGTDSGDTVKLLHDLACRGSETYEERRSAVLDRYRRKYGSADISRMDVNDLISPSRIDFSISPQYALIDGRYAMYCFIPSGAYPVRAVGGWTQTLFSAYDGVDVDMWIQREDTARVQQRLSYELKSNRIKEKNTDDVAQNYDDIESALSAGYYLKSAIASGDDFCYMSTLITITGASIDEMNSRYREIRDHLIRNDLRLRKCWFQQSQAYLSALPFARLDRGLFLKSRRNITGSQLGSIYPFTAYELNDEGGIFFGINPRYGSPVFINIFDRSRYQNANMLILGESGSGKTYTLMSMLLRMRQKGLQIYTIAPYKGSEFMRACTAVGGEFVSVAPGSKQNINIMEIRRYDSSSVIIDGELASSNSVLTAKIQQIERFFSILLSDMTVEESHILDDTLMEVYGSFGITADNRSLEDASRPGSYKKMPVLGDLYESLLSRGTGAVRLSGVLSRFVTGSARSFNGQTNVDLSNRFVVLDVSEMTNEMLPVGMFIALDFVLDAAKADRTVNKVIAIDEMWRLMSASDLTSEFTVEVFKIIRGYGGSAIGATQDLDDVLKDESGAAIINNAKIKFFLPMERREAKAIADIVDITEEEMKQMKTGRALRSRDRKMLMVAGANHVFVSVRTSPREHDLITTNADDLARIAGKKRSAETSERIFFNDF